MLEALVTLHFSSLPLLAAMYLVIKPQSSVDTNHLEIEGRAQGRRFPSDSKRGQVVRKLRAFLPNKEALLGGTISLGHLPEQARVCPALATLEDAHEQFAAGRSQGGTRRVERLLEGLERLCGSAWGGNPWSRGVFPPSFHPLPPSLHSSLPGASEVDGWSRFWCSSYWVVFATVTASVHPAAHPTAAQAPANRCQTPIQAPANCCQTPVRGPAKSCRAVACRRYRL